MDFFFLNKQSKRRWGGEHSKWDKLEAFSKMIGPYPNISILTLNVNESNALSNRHILSAKI